VRRETWFRAVGLNSLLSVKVRMVPAGMALRAMWLESFKVRLPSSLLISSVQFRRSLVSVMTNSTHGPPFPAMRPKKGSEAPSSSSSSPPPRNSSAETALYSFRMIGLLGAKTSMR